MVVEYIIRCTFSLQNVLEITTTCIPILVTATSFWWSQKAFPDIIPRSTKNVRPLNTKEYYTTTKSVFCEYVLVATITVHKKLEQFQPNVKCVSRNNTRGEVTSMNWELNFTSGRFKGGRPPPIGSEFFQKAAFSV